MSRKSQQAASSSEEDDDGWSESSSTTESESNEDDGFLTWDHSTREKRRKEALQSSKHRIEQLQEQLDNDKSTPNGQHLLSAAPSTLSPQSPSHKETFKKSDDDDDDADTFYNESSSDDDSDDSDASYYSSGFDNDHDDDSDNSDEDSTSHHSKTGWSLRVRLLEVENFPARLAPQIPFCPIIKFGLVSSTKQILVLPNGNEETAKTAPTLTKNYIPNSPHDAIRHEEANAVDQAADKALQAFQARKKLQMLEYQNLPVEKKLERFGLAKIKNSRGLCSSSSITTVRDSSKFQWYEEFRWDSVSKPLQTLLAIELCGKSLFSNYPPSTTQLNPRQSHASNSLGVSLSPSSNDLKSHHFRADSNHFNDPRSMFSNHPPSLELKNLSLASLWRRGRQTFVRTGPNAVLPGLGLTRPTVNTNELEAASAATKVAEFLVQSNNKNDDKNSRNNHNNPFDNVENNNAKPLSSTTHSRLNQLSRYSSNLNNPLAQKRKFQEDFRLGTLLIPLSQLPLEDATSTTHVSGASKRRKYAVIDQWYQIGLSSGITPKNNSTDNNNSTKQKQPKLPSVRLEISFASSACLDESEDEFTDNEEEEDDDDVTMITQKELDKIEKDFGGHQQQQRQLQKGDSGFFSVSTVSTMRSSLKDKVRRQSTQLRKSAVLNPNGPKDPVVEPGIVDFICVLGAKDIGNLKDDDGTFGWVKSNPECCIFEQFPKADEFHTKNGREAALPNKVEWFCFPEGWKLWRGVDPPTARDINVLNSSSVSSSHHHQQSSSSPFSSSDTTQSAGSTIEHHHISSSNPAFDKCLNCTTSFSWFVISSTSESYGSRNVKTFGAVIRFYAPAPCGIDPTQDDFAQTSATPVYQSENSVPMGSPHREDRRRRRSSLLKRVRFWVPMGICVTSSYPIVGVLEAILLRICQTIGSREVNQRTLYEDLANLIVNFQAPIPGVLHCSIPFLHGQRFHVTLSPPTGLPSLPHGGSVTAVCKLIGATGLVNLLAAVLTECKVLLHSKDVSNLPMVGEVITALIFPFVWELPYIPVLPEAMLEFVEAPMSYLVGIPSSALKWVDNEVLSDIVVVDLDNIIVTTADSTNYESVRTNYKSPCPLPTHISNGISANVLKLLKEAEEVETQYGDHSNTFASEGVHLPRLESEDLAEREFRINIALHISSLLRGYHDCLFFVSSSQPVFNRERFLRTADALFEEKRDPSGVIHRVISQRSKRFLLPLVNTQGFHNLLERIYSDDHSFFPFFHEIMDALDLNEERCDINVASAQRFSRSTINQLNASLQKVEDAVPTYRVYRNNPGESNLESAFGDEHGLFTEDAPMVSFTSHMLKPIVAMPQAQFGKAAGGNNSGARSLSLQYLVEIEKNPWEYSKLFDIPCDIPKGIAACQLRPKVTILSAIGESRYRAYLESKKNITKEQNSDDKANLNNLLINNLLSSAKDEFEKMDAPSASKVNRERDARDREILRRCLERAIGGSQQSASGISFVENGRDLIQDAEIALRNPSAQLFLLSLLSQRARLEKQRQLRQNVAGLRRGNIQNSTSRILPSAFECLVRLCNAMLGAAMAEQDYESAYRLLTHTYGFCTLMHKPGSHDDKKLVFMTAKIGMHPVFTDLSLWEKVIEIHLLENNSSPATSNARPDSHTGTAEYDATVTTLYEMVGYGVPTEELVRFVTRVSNARAWFSAEKTQSLLSLVRKLSMKRDNEVSDNSSIPPYPTNSDTNVSGIEFGSSRKGSLLKSINAEDWSNSKHKVEEIEEDGIAWYHPTSTDNQPGLPNKSLSAGNLHTEISSDYEQNPKQTQGTKDVNNILYPTGFDGRNSITSVASFGACAVVTGSLDGSVFLSHTISKDEVKGVHLEWGNKQKNVGLVSCIASVRAAGYRHKPETHSTESDEEFISKMEGCRVVAGSAGGALNMWNLKAVYRQIVDLESDGFTNDFRTYHGNGIEGPTSVFMNALNKGESAFKGRSLSGHTGAVSCIDVPSTVYRPDSLISGGEDGLIKLWSLRNPVSNSNGEDMQRSIRTSRFFGAKPFLQPDAISAEQKSSGDAQAVLKGHQGTVLCVKTAWHGDRVLSGGVDGKVMLWDLAGGDGKCLQEMIGHTLWVTHAQYWGPHTIVSASTDRSVALWDARVANDPLFILRHHDSHVSDILLGSRTDPLMVTAGGDGTLATWDLRIMTNSKENLKPGRTTKTKTNRQPLASMNHAEGSNCSGSILLTRGANSHEKSVLSAGTDGIIKEWDIASGRYLGKQFTGHFDAISCLTSFTENDGLSRSQEGPRQDSNSSGVSGILSCSWDGIVRLRRVNIKKERHE